MKKFKGFFDTKQYKVSRLRLAKLINDIQVKKEK